jgi:hypothetical protein
MSHDYIRSLFEVIDGKISYKQIGQKKRGRKPGYQHSEETKSKIADQMRGRVKTSETRDQISKSLLGRPKSEETKDKISKQKQEHDVGRDLLASYGIKIPGPRPPKDQLCPTVNCVEWIKQHGDLEEVQVWIEENAAKFREVAVDVCCESKLKESVYKGAQLEYDNE